MSDQPLVSVRAVHPEFHGRRLPPQPPPDETLSVIGCRSTLIYCWPHCPGRGRVATDVQLFASARQAEQAGFRACPACHPAADCSGQPATAGDVLRAAVSPATQQRLVAGRRQLAPWQRATASLFGILPAVTERHSRPEPVDFDTAACCLGIVLLAATAHGICALYLGDSASALRRLLEERFADATLRPARGCLQDLLGRAVALVRRPWEPHSLPLDLRGSSFQRQVWRRLADIPAGQTRTHTQLAAALGMPGAVRAVAQACAANQLAVAVPCHRVVRCDGRMTDYAWGPPRQRALLHDEAVHAMPQPAVLHG